MIRTLALITVTAAVMAAGAACTGQAGPTRPPATTPAATRNLDGVLATPEGYQPMANDTLSGPLSSEADIRGMFIEHPEDAGMILDNGFEAGYAQYWRQNPTGAVTSPNFPLRPNAHGIVLRFATPEGARTVLRYFRQRNEEDRYTFFAVPDALDNGYGSSVTLPGDAANPTTHTYAVAWTRGTHVFELGISYFQPPESPAEVIALALHQASSG